MNGLEKIPSKTAFVASQPKIRPFRISDAAQIANLTRAAIANTDLLDYTRRQISAWAARVATPDQIVSRCADGRYVLVAVNSTDDPIAFIELRPDGHLDFFYCHPQHIGTGVGATLYDHLEQWAISSGIQRISTEASEAARRFFIHKGFMVACRRDFEIEGVEIHNFKMKKELTIV